MQIINSQEFRQIFKFNLPIGFGNPHSSDLRPNTNLYMRFSTLFVLDKGDPLVQWLDHQLTSGGLDYQKLSVSFYFYLKRNFRTGLRIKMERTDFSNGT